MADDEDFVVTPAMRAYLAAFDALLAAAPGPGRVVFTLAKDRAFTKLMAEAETRRRAVTVRGILWRSPQHPDYVVPSAATRSHSRLRPSGVRGALACRAKW